MPTTGRGRRHLSLGGPATAVTPDHREVSGDAATAAMPGPGVCAGRSPPAPSLVPSFGAAALPEERPSRALCPAAPASRAHRLRPSPQTPNLGRMEQHSRAATTTSGAPERTSARRARPLRTHRASGPPARPSFPSYPAAAPAAPWAAALGVGTVLGQGAEVGSRPTGVARRPREQAGTNGPRGAGPGEPRRGARLQAAVRGGESAAVSPGREGSPGGGGSVRAAGRGRGGAWRSSRRARGFVYFLGWLRRWRVGRGSRLTLAPRGGGED